MTLPATPEAAALAVTLDPLLPSDELANLSLSADPAVRSGVAAHPNTSAYILGTLAADFPAQVLHNPALPLLRLATPTFMASWPPSGVLALIRLPDAPRWLRNLALNDPRPEFKVAVATHPDLTPQEMTYLAGQPAWLVRARIAARPDAPQALLNALVHDPDYGVRLALAARPDLPPGGAEVLLHDSSRMVRQVMRQTLGFTARPSSPA